MESTYDAKDTVKVVVRYFAEARATIHGTPLVPVEVEVSPSLDVGSLKYMICYAADLIEDMMTLMTPKKPESEETSFFARTRPSAFSMPTVGSGAGMIDVFRSRRLSEDLKVGELDTWNLALSIDVDWLTKCPVCGQQNNLSDIRSVTGLDNIPDLDGDYSCSNPRCTERKAQKKFDIRIAHWRSEDGTMQAIPLITSIMNGASCSDIHGSKTRPPGPCSLGSNAENPKLSKSEYCRCGAHNPSDVLYCWNCGKKNRNPQPKPPMPLPYDLESLRESVMSGEKEEQVKTVRRSIDAVQELMRRGAIVEITFCKHCGTENNVNNVKCLKCGAQLSKTPLVIPTKRRPWWQFW